jgi:hypothetical protein
MTNEEILNLAIFALGGLIAVLTDAWIVGLVVASVAFANLATVRS